MTIPILKKRVWIPVKDDLDPKGHWWVHIDEWMPLGSLFRFTNNKWIPIGDEEEDDDWIPMDEVMPYYEDGQGRVGTR